MTPLSTAVAAAMAFRTAGPVGVRSSKSSNAERNGAASAPASAAFCDSVRATIIMPDVDREHRGAEKRHHARGDHDERHAALVAKSGLKACHCCSPVSRLYCVISFSSSRCGSPAHERACPAPSDASPQSCALPRDARSRSAAARRRGAPALSRACRPRPSPCAACSCCSSQRLRSIAACSSRRFSSSFFSRCLARGSRSCAPRRALSSASSLLRLARAASIAASLTVPLCLFALEPGDFFLRAFRGLAVRGSSRPGSTDAAGA